MSAIDLQYESKQEPESAKNPDARLIARKALQQVLEPLAGFVLDAGLSTAELNAMFREAAVRSAASKQLERSNRVNISGIAATTGIPRAEISRILKATTRRSRGTGDEQRQSTNRILAAWHEDPKFTFPNGKPADLRVYGRGPTFESLAKKYGRGIPTRAVLDELLRSGAVELLPRQKIRAVASVAVERGMSARVMKVFGERAAELLSTMLFNMRKPDAPRFVASVSDASVLSTSLPLIRKEISNKGADFLADLQETLNRNPEDRHATRKRKYSSRVSVTIFYNESAEKKSRQKATRSVRRNFRREI